MHGKNTILVYTVSRANTSQKSFRECAGIDPRANSAIESEGSILSTGNGCLEGISRCDKVGGNFGACIVPTLLRGCNAWIVVADSITRFFKQVVCSRPRMICVLPEARDGFAVGSKMTKISHGHGLSIYQLYFHECPMCEYKAAGRP